MAQLFESGRIIDLILILITLEVAALPWLLRRLGASVTPGLLLPNILAGAALMLAVRLSLTDASWTLIGAALAAALIAHLADLWLRLASD